MLILTDIALTLLLLLLPLQISDGKMTKRMLLLLQSTTLKVHSVPLQKVLYLKSKQQLIFCPDE